MIHSRHRRRFHNHFLQVGIVRFIYEMAMGMVQFIYGMAMGMVRFIYGMAMGMVRFIYEMVMGMVQFVCEIMKGMDQSARDRIRFILSVSDNEASARTVSAWKTRVAIHFPISSTNP